MISRENFIKIMEALRIQNDQEVLFSESMSEILKSYVVFSLNSGNIYSEIAAALESELSLHGDEAWIEWWMWECDFGRKPGAGYVEDRHRVGYTLKMHGEMYDFLNNLIDEYK